MLKNLTNLALCIVDLQKMLFFCHCLPAQVLLLIQYLGVNFFFRFAIEKKTYDFCPAVERQFNFLGGTYSIHPLWSE